jgi:starch synthase
MRTLRIAHVTSEITPFAKTGGLADVSAALPAFLHRAGHDVRVFTPKHGVIDAESYEFEPVDGLSGLSMRLGVDRVSYGIVRSPLPGSGLEVDFVDCPALYARPHIYTDGPDEHLRFILLARAALETCQQTGWVPDVIHGHDWQTGLVPLYLKTLYHWDELFRPTRSILTIHNIGYQGRFPAEILPDTGLEASAKFFFQQDLRDGVVGFLKTGILYADCVTTVSPTYAEEIRTEPFGAGLHELMRERGQTLLGILNGVDTEAWNPATDEHLAFPFSASSVERKEKNKEALLEDLHLPYEKHAPLVGMVTRLTGQKGLELLYEPLPEMLDSSNARLVVLGSGESRYERYFRELQDAFPDRVCFYRGFHEGLAHRIEAGADMFLMPSIYEPCGLNQMYSLIYGTIPIVRKTGGLADTVKLWNTETQEGNGIVFDHPTADGVRWALKTALELYRDRSAWKVLVQNAMSGDWSWDAAGRRYLDLYEELSRTEKAEV